MKRLFDVVVSAVVLVILSPLLLLVALAVWIALGRPILFRQVRPGFRRLPFTLLKFRTMSDERDHTGRLLPDGARLGRMGRLLRASSVDELPELVNVLRGEMSLVGPRPLLMEYLPRYTVEQARRHDVKPGITGWAQINGRNALSWEHRFELDVWYVDHRSFWLDVKIIFRSAWIVLTGRGIAEKGHATMTPFAGTRQ